MASSKNIFILLGLLFALVLLISSEVAASEESMKTSSVEDANFGGGPGYGYPGKGGGRNGGRNGGRGGYGGGGRCKYGCCRGYRYQSGCKRCCGNALEAPDAEFEDDVKN